MLHVCLIGDEIDYTLIHTCVCINQASTELYELLCTMHMITVQYARKEETHNHNAIGSYAIYDMIVKTIYLYKNDN